MEFARKICFIYGYSHCSRWSLGHITSMQNIQVRSSSHPPLQLLGNFIRCLKAQSFLAAWGEMLDSHVRKRRMNLWMKQEKPKQMLLSSTNAHDVYIFSLTFWVPDTGERFRLQTSASLEDDPRSRYPKVSKWVKERRGFFSGWSHDRGQSIEFLNLFAIPRYWRI